MIRGESVQGPWYRTMIKRELQMLRKLKGSFYEHEDGKKTEVIVQGTRVRVESFIRWVEQGPQVALRDPITLDKVEYLDKLSPFTGFEIIKIRAEEEDQQK
jgi:acylphosphatase